MSLAGNHIAHVELPIVGNHLAKEDAAVTETPVLSGDSQMMAGSTADADVVAGRQSDCVGLV